MVKKKSKLDDKDIDVGDSVLLKVGKKKKLITTTIKWKGTGKFFGAGIWYRIDINGSRIFVDKKSIKKIVKKTIKKKPVKIVKSKPKKQNKKLKDDNKKAKKVKNKWINLHFVGYPNTQQQKKSMKLLLSQSSTLILHDDDDGKDDEKDQKYDEKYDEKDDEKKIETGPVNVPNIAKNINDKYSLKNIETQSIRIQVNPLKYTVKQLKNEIKKTFNINNQIKILLVYNNCIVSLNNAAIYYYGIDNHSCLLLCLKETAIPKAVINGMSLADIPPAPVQQRNDRRRIAPRIRRRRHRMRRAPRPVMRIRNNTGLPNANNNNNNIQNRRTVSMLPQTTNINNNDGGIVGVNNPIQVAIPMVLRPPIPNISIPDVPTPNIHRANTAMPNSNPNTLKLTQSTTSAVTAAGGNKKDKIITTRDKTVKFCKKFQIERITDLDIYMQMIDHNCIKMPCGHGMAKESLFAYVEAQLKDNNRKITCPHLKDPMSRKNNSLCKKVWNFQLIRKVLLCGRSPNIGINKQQSDTKWIQKWENSIYGLIICGYMRSSTSMSMNILLLIYKYSINRKFEAQLRRNDYKKMMKLEIFCGKIKFIDQYDYQKCPNCSLFIYRKQKKMNNIKCYCLCPSCSYDFCWICSNKWKSIKYTEHCGNNNCSISWTLQHLSILKTCKKKKIGSVSGVPEVRACPKCSELITHWNACKHMDCRTCKTKFCFVCLKLYNKKRDKWPCGSYSSKCKIAKRQKLNNLSGANRGNVKLF